MAEEKKTPTFLVDKKKNAQAAPSKKTMNFARHQEGSQLKKILPAAIIVIAVLALLLKFGVLDQLDKKNAAMMELTTRQSELDAVNLRLASFAELEQEYSRYSFSLMNESETGLVDRLQIISLIEQRISRTAVVEDFAINGNVLTTNISGINLDEASKIVQKLESSKLVESATVYSAAAADGEEATIFMSIILTKEAAEK